MAVSKNVSKLGLWFLLCTAGLAGAQSVACSSKFTSCAVSRTCTPEPDESAGAAGDRDDAGGTSGGTAHPSAGASGLGYAGAGGGAGAMPVEAGAGGTGPAAGANEAGEGGVGASGEGGASGSGEGGAGSDDGPVGCNTVVQASELVNPQNNAGALPAGTHGSIKPGKYVLSKTEWFNGATSNTAVRSTLLVSVSNAVVTIQGIDEFIADHPYRYTRTLATNDPVTSTYTCIAPDAGIYPTLNTPAPADYSATNTTLVLIFAVYQLTYVMQ